MFENLALKIFCRKHVEILRFINNILRFILHSLWNFDHTVTRYISCDYVREISKQSERVYIYIEVTKYLVKY